MNGAVHNPKSCPLCARLRHPSHAGRRVATGLPPLPQQKFGGNGCSRTASGAEHKPSQ